MSVEDFLGAATKRKAKEAEITEDDIEQAYCKYAKRKKCVAMKLVFLRKKGFPDRTTMCPGGRVLFIEFKRKGKKASPAQILVRKALETLGFEYHVCDEIGQAENILDNFLAFDE